MSFAVGRSCPECSYPLDQHDRDFRFRLPDEFTDLTDAQQAARLDGDDTFLRVDSTRTFLRSIVPIQLRGGHLVAYAAWMETDLETIRAAYSVWDQPGYAALAIEGNLANALPPWPSQSFGAAVRAEPRHADELPYVVASSDEAFASVLDGAWEHAQVLGTFDAR